MIWLAVIALAFLGLIEIALRLVVSLLLVCTILGTIVLIELSDNGHPLHELTLLPLAADIARKG